jgi:hypothetical protein
MSRSSDSSQTNLEKDSHYDGDGMDSLEGVSEYSEGEQWNGARSGGKNELGRRRCVVWNLLIKDFSFMPLKLCI